MAKTEPVVLTKEQAELAERVKYFYGAQETVVLYADRTSMQRDIYELRETGLSLDNLIRALYVGYTVEKTQEEREADVRSWYEELENIRLISKRLGSEDKVADGAQMGVRGTLLRLGIKIEGVNE